MKNKKLKRTNKVLEALQAANNERSMGPGATESDIKMVPPLRWVISAIYT